MLKSDVVLTIFAFTQGLVDDSHAKGAELKLTPYLIVGLDYYKGCRQA